MESSAMKDAFDEIERLSQDPETRYVALSREKFLKDQMQREEDARDEREKEIILNMLHEKLPKEMIAKLTNVSIEKIEEITQSEFDPS